MDRKEFLKICGGTCLGLVGFSILNQSCKGIHYAQSSVSGNQLSVPVSEFIVMDKGKTSYRKQIVIKSDKLDYPIVVYRTKNNSYHAMLMRCTHQGIELNINGDILSCSAHGSEFSNTGEVIQGPAEERLKSFLVLETDNMIHIQLV